MDMSSLFEGVGKLTSVAAALAGVWWGFEKWRRRDEHFPRVYFEVGVNFIGRKEQQFIVELVATLENKGVVPLKIKPFTFKLLGLMKSDAISRGGAAIRGQLLFRHMLAEGAFVPPEWDYSFIYPGVRTEYNFVTSIPFEVEYVRMQGDFTYLPSHETHHAARVSKVPSSPSAEASPSENTL